MDLDKYQQAWQSQASQTRVTVDPSLLLKEVQRNRQDFQSTILLRDMREVLVAMVMIPVWFYLGARRELPWTWYLVVPAFVWVAGYILVDRWRHPRQSSEPGEPLVRSVQHSLAEVERQIWLLRNVHWWYLLPFTLPIMAFFAQVTWRTYQKIGPEALASGAFSTFFVLALYSFIYWLNQVAVKKTLEPRRQELLALLASLKDETSSADERRDVARNIRKVAERSEETRSPWRALAIILLLAVITGLASVAAFLAGKPAPEYAKRSPFAAVRWSDSQPEVEVDDQWYKLVSLDGIAIGDIVAYSRRTYEDLWQKRFEEDLVELLEGMGHAPQETVELVVRPITSLFDAEDKTLSRIPMTEANRDAIFAAALERDLTKRRPVPRNTAPINAAKVPLAESIPALRQQRDLVGLAAMVAVGGQVVDSAVDGERKLWSSVPLQMSDRWYLGGVAKSVTATMIARLVESGQMKWTDAVGDAFPDAPIHEDWKPVTLKQLLTDTAGAPTNFPKDLWLLRPPLGPERTQARLEAVQSVIAEKPAYPPGKAFQYSNAGYPIAAAMAEQATGATWEELVKREVFEPLELADAGFRAPKSPEETLDQPRGHRAYLGKKYAADDDAGNSPIMSASGDVHMSLQNLCVFARDHLLGERGEGKLLSAETYQLLHSPERDGYAYGWMKREPTTELPYATYWHNGSNTLWYALVVFIPEKDMVVAVVSNDGDYAQAEAAAWEIVKGSAKQFPKPAPP